MLVDDVIAHGVYQVSLAQTGPAVNKEGIIGLARLVGYGKGGGVSELVATPDDEVGEGVGGAEAVEGDLLRRLGRR